MGWYKSEVEAAGWALVELEGKLKAPFNEKEWGTIIYRASDSEGSIWYSYLSLTPGEKSEWEPTILVPEWASARAYCHTHPAITGFSKTDIDTALGYTFPYPACTMYMVNPAGAYWYNGTYKIGDYARNSLVRYGTLWGEPYATMVKR